MFGFGNSSNEQPKATSIPDYKYQNFIRTPDAMGASSAGNLTALSNNIKAMQGYVDVLVSGKSKSQTVSPLGNKYFMYSNTDCEDTNKQKQDRYVFINNIPDGKIPLLGVNKDLRGLVPGLLEGASYMNPAKLFSAFSTDKSCQKVTLQVRDESNITSDESRYVLNSDLLEYNPCWFAEGSSKKGKKGKKINPVTGEQCEGFHLRNAHSVNQTMHFYVLGVGLIVALIGYRIGQKKN